jgi:type IV pilus assembly protein PilN
MIRINLLPVRERRKRREGRQILALFIVLLAAQLMGIYYLHAELAAEQDHVAAQLRALDKEIEKRRGVQQRIGELENTKTGLLAQVELFGLLEEEKEGPSKLLLFLAYALTPRKETPYNREELQILERLGWDTNWDPDRLWLQTMSTRRASLEISGTAMSHEDVAEFSKRLRTSIFFPGVEPLQQIQDYDRELDLASVSFRLQSDLYGSEQDEDTARRRKRKRKR